MLSIFSQIIPRGDLNLHLHGFSKKKPEFMLSIFFYLKNGFYEITKNKKLGK